MPRYDDDEELRELHEKLNKCFDQKPNQKTNQNKNRFEGETVEMSERKGANGKTIYEPINDTNNNYNDNEEKYNVKKYNHTTESNGTPLWKKILKTTGIIALVSAIATFVSTYLLIKTTGFILKHWKEIAVLLIGSAIIANSNGGCSIIDIEEPKKKSYSQYNSEIYNDASKKMESLVKNKSIKTKGLNKLNNPKTL